MAVVAVCLAPFAVATPLSAQTAAQAEPQTRQEILQRQREEKRGQLEPYVVSRAEERVQFLETWRLPFRLFAKGVGGFRPVVGGLPSGSGLVGGGGYITGYNSDLLQFTANARYSTRGYQAYDAGLLIFPRTNSILPVEGYVTGGVRDLTSLRFFGLGSDSSRGGRTTYRLQDRSVETGMTAWAGKVAEFGARVQWLRTETGPGQAGTSLDDRFDPDTIPGFGAEHEFLRLWWTSDGSPPRVECHSLGRRDGRRGGVALRRSGSRRLRLHPCRGRRPGAHSVRTSQPHPGAARPHLAFGRGGRTGDPSRSS